MTFEDKTITCVECGATFTFSANEQEFHTSKGYQNDPKRCPASRQNARRSRGGNRESRAAREMFDITCAECGSQSQVPFQPRSDRPVYCSSCYSKIRIPG